MQEATHYINEIPNPTEMLRTKWNSNEFSFDSYAFATNRAGSKHFKKFKKPLQEKIFFAGEHTSKKYRGTVHGAYLSGISAAKKIIKKFNL